MAESTDRLFIALWPDEAVRAALVAQQRAWTWPAGAARVAPQKLHVTLHFLGDVAHSRLDALAEGIAVPFSPFDLQPTSASVWRGGIAVLEADAPPPLLALHAALGDALRSLGFEPESRPYRAHVTLARHAQVAIAPAEIAPLRWAVDGYALVRSAGGAYTVLRRYP